MIGAGKLAEQLGPVRLPRLERLAVHPILRGGASLRGFAALPPSIPALRVVELHCCCGGGNYRCPVISCTSPKTVELLAELWAAWPGLELPRGRWDPDDWTQA